MANLSLPQTRRQFIPKRSCVYEKCFRCRQQITNEEFVMSTEQSFHVNCFKCALCGKQLIPGEHTIYDRYTYCKVDCIPVDEKEVVSEQLKAFVYDRNSTAKNCVKCNLSVRGRDYVTSMDKVWHRVCFRCELCKRYLTISDHIMKNAKSYCKYPCFQRKFFH